MIILLDTGPLVSFLNKSDTYHRWAFDTLSNISPPWKTCEIVLAEAFYLTRHIDGTDSILDMLKEGVLEIDFELSSHTGRLQELTRKFKDVPMSVADACLVRMSEMFKGAYVVTLDSDFTLYRRFRNQTLPLLMPKV